jgi:death-on-curing protein
VDDIQWLSAAEVRLIHDSILEPGQLIGEDGTRSIESAIARVEQQVHYGQIEPDVIHIAATYAVVISRAHSFNVNDGNKRTALVSMLMFLDAHGYDLEIDQIELANRMEDCAAGIFDDTDLWSIIFEHLTELQH